MRDYSYLFMVPFGIQAFNVDTIEQDLSFYGIVEPLNHWYDARLSTAARPHKCDDFVLLDFNANSL